MVSRIKLSTFETNANEVISLKPNLTRVYDDLGPKKMLRLRRAFVPINKNLDPQPQNSARCP